ncbi:Uncharacterised protein [Klebsiella pneumoniae]|nr:Uncharacterised protein [Klebsiella pneumoniae]
MRRGIASLICFFAHCESSVDWRRLTGRHPAPHLIKNDDSCKAHFGGLFLWAKKSPHGFMQARQLHLDFVPVYVFLSGSRKILSRIHFVNNGFKSQGHAFAWLFYYQVPQESSSTRFVVKSSPMGQPPLFTQHPVNPEVETMKMPDKIFSAASYCTSGGLICTGLAQTYD